MALAGDAEILERVMAHATGSGDGEWIVGAGWDEAEWADCRNAPGVAFAGGGLYLRPRDMAKIGQLAWGAIKAMIPPTLVRILVEKLVAMLVPVAGAVMVIIEGLKAAWGAGEK